MSNEYDEEDEDEEDDLSDPFAVNWDIRREGRAWDKNVRERYGRTPEKIELYQGKLFWSDEERLMMLGLLLENVGVDAAVKLGNPDVWREAAAGLETSKDTQNI